MKPMPCRISLRARSGVIVGVKPSRHQQVERVLLQGQFQQHGFVLEKVKAVPGHLGAAFEIDQVELLAQLDVIERLESRTWAARVLPRRTSALASSPPTGASGCVRFGHRVAGWRPTSASDAHRARPVRRSVCSRSWRPSSLRASRSAASFALPIDLLDFVGLAIELFDLGLLISRRCDSSSTKRSTSAFDAAAVAVLLHELGVFENESLIEHADAYAGVQSLIRTSIVLAISAIQCLVLSSSHRCALARDAAVDSRPGKTFRSGCACCRR